MQIDAVTVTVAVCTFKRVSGLRRCLMSLGAMTRPAGLQIEVLVVDNDCSRSANVVVATLAKDFPFLLRYFCETRSGVSHARNHAVAEAHGEWVAFVDDDEWIEPGWLSAFWAVAQNTSVDAVFGPVIAEFEQPAPAWLLASGAHQRPRYATGTPMRWGDCRSGNVLFRRWLFVAHRGFDPRFAASGGEDCDFFWRCMAGGARLVWCDEALVHEHVPLSRMRRPWLLRRAFNGGRSFARLRAMRRGVASYGVDAAWGLINVLAYLVPALLARMVGHVRALAFERKLAGGLGKLVAAFAGASGEYGGDGASRVPD